MIIIPNKDELFRRYAKSLAIDRKVRLYVSIKELNRINQSGVKGRMNIVNLYRSLAKTLERASLTRTGTTFVSFSNVLREEAKRKIEEYASLFHETVTRQSVAINSVAIEDGIERFFNVKPTVVIPDTFWRDNAIYGVSVVDRFSKSIDAIIDRAIEIDRSPNRSNDYAVFLPSIEKTGILRVGNEAWGIQSDTAKAVQSFAGCTSYIWKNKGDERVVGNPSGLYPTANAHHGNHWEREGQTFEWSKPPWDGHPGTAPGCRCMALPLFSLNNPSIR